MIQVNLTDSTQLETPAPQSKKKQLFFTIICCRYLTTFQPFQYVLRPLRAGLLDVHPARRSGKATHRQAARLATRYKHTEFRPLCTTLLVRRALPSWLFPGVCSTNHADISNSEFGISKYTSSYVPKYSTCTPRRRIPTYVGVSNQKVFPHRLIVRGERDES